MSTHRKTWSKSEKLAVIHMASTEGVAKACRHYNVSQTSFYKWKAKLESVGESALETRGGDQLSKQNAQLLYENRMLKQIIAEKELKLMIQDELLKKSR
jgi:transposase-like protein